MVIAFSFIPTSWSCAKKLAPPSRAYLPASSVTPKAPTAPAEPVRTRAAKMPAHAAARSRMPPPRSAAGHGLLTLRAREDASVRLGLRAPPISTLPVLGIVLAAGLLAVQYASQAREWAVMTDELQTSKLATSIAQTLSPVPQIHGEYYGALNQLFVLALGLPIAVLGYERSLRGVVSRHRLLAVAYGGAAVVAVVLAAAGSLTRVLGNYGGTVQGNPLPAAVWRAAAVHLDDAVVATGVVPFVLGAAWSLTALLGPSRREARAFAVLFLTLVPLVTLEAASFDLRFTPGHFVQDRYVSYLAPLFAVGAAACLLDRPRRSLRAALVLAAGVVFVGLAALASFGDRPVLFWASPAAAFHQALRSAAGAIGLSTDDLVRWGGLLFAALVAGALWRLPSRATVAVLGVALTAYGAFEAYYVFDWFAVPGTARPLRLEGVRRDWIDAAVPAGASA